MTTLVIALAAVLLSLERLCYIFAWRRPERFQSICARFHVADDGVSALERLFYWFKLIQAAVFLAWCLHFSGGGGLGLSPDPRAIVGGLLLIAAGQVLNIASVWRLGRIGIFYGVRFGHAVPRCRRFPYSVFDHPQYVGTVATIFGLFLAIRFPQPDWIVLPAIEALYYMLGAKLEDDRAGAAAPADAASKPVRPLGSDS